MEWVTPKENAKRKVLVSVKFAENIRRGNYSGLDFHHFMQVICLRFQDPIFQSVVAESKIPQVDGVGHIMKMDPNEEWREIEINSQKYRVSSLRRVQLTNVLITRGSLYAGYYRVSRVHKYRVHRSVALAFFPKKKVKII